VKRSISCGLVFSMPLLVGSADFAEAQHEGMKMSMNTLFVAQLDAKQVVGGSTSTATATGTGAFLLDRTQRTLEFNLTYEGLASGGAQNIAIHNFGQGKNGEVVTVLCGGDARPCLDGPSATISDRLGRPLDSNLLGEFASERTYVEIVGRDGKPEIRGQLSPNSAMVKVTNYTVHLTPTEGTDSKGTGTAVVSETHLPGGKVSVFYAATVAGTSGAPTNAALVNGPTPQERMFTSRSALPKMLRSSSDKKSGGSLTGVYEVNRDAPTALSVTRLMAEKKGESGMVVTTSRFPNGELYGALVSVP